MKKYFLSLLCVMLFFAGSVSYAYTTIDSHNYTDLENGVNRESVANHINTYYSQYMKNDFIIVRVFVTDYYVFSSNNYDFSSFVIDDGTNLNFVPSITGEAIWFNYTDYSKELYQARLYNNEDVNLKFNKNSINEIWTNLDFGIDIGLPSDMIHSNDNFLKEVIPPKIARIGGVENGLSYSMDNIPLITVFNENIDNFVFNLSVRDLSTGQSVLEGLKDRSFIELSIGDTYIFDNSLLDQDLLIGGNSYEVKVYNNIYSFGSSYNLFDTVTFTVDSLGDIPVIRFDSPVTGNSYWSKPPISIYNYLIDYPYDIYLNGIKIDSYDPSISIHSRYMIDKPNYKIGTNNIELKKLDGTVIISTSYVLTNDNLDFWDSTPDYKDYSVSSVDPPQFPENPDLFNLIKYVFDGIIFLISYIISGIGQLIKLSGDMLTVFGQLLSSFPRDLWLVITLGTTITIVTALRR